MRRWHNEYYLMKNRQKFEKMWHGRDDTFGDSFENCHCSGGIGQFRKHRPLQGYNHLARWIHAIDQMAKKQRNKKLRQQKIDVDEYI